MQSSKSSPHYRPPSALPSRNPLRPPAAAPEPEPAQPTHVNQACEEILARILGGRPAIDSALSEPAVGARNLIVAHLNAWQQFFCARFREPIRNPPAALARL